MIPTVIQPVGSQEDIASFKGDPSQKDYEPLLERGSSPKLHYKCTVFLETFCFLELGPMRTVHNESSTCDISKPGELKPETRSCKCESIWLFLKFGWTDPLMIIYCVHIYIYIYEEILFSLTPSREAKHWVVYRTAENGDLNVCSSVSRFYSDQCPSV